MNRIKIKLKNQLIPVSSAPVRILLTTYKGNGIIKIINTFYFGRVMLFNYLVFEYERKSIMNASSILYELILTLEGKREKKPLKKKTLEKVKNEILEKIEDNNVREVWERYSKLFSLLEQQGEKLEHVKGFLDYKIKNECNITLSEIAMTLGLSEEEYINITDKDKPVFNDRQLGKLIEIFNMNSAEAYHFSRINGSEEPLYSCLAQQQKHERKLVIYLLKYRERHTDNVILAQAMLEMTMRASQIIFTLLPRVMHKKDDLLKGASESVRNAWERYEKLITDIKNDPVGMSDLKNYIMIGWKKANKEKKATQKTLAETLGITEAAYSGHWSRASYSRLKAKSIINYEMSEKIIGLCKFNSAQAYYFSVLNAGTESIYDDLAEQQLEDRELAKIILNFVENNTKEKLKDDSEFKYNKYLDKLIEDREFSCEKIYRDALGEIEERLKASEIKLIGFKQLGASPEDKERRTEALTAYENARAEGKKERIIGDAPVIYGTVEWKEIFRDNIIGCWFDPDIGDVRTVRKYIKQGFRHSKPLLLQVCMILRMSYYTAKFYAAKSEHSLFYSEDILSGQQVYDNIVIKAMKKRNYSPIEVNEAIVKKGEEKTEFGYGFLQPLMSPAFCNIWNVWLQYVNNPEDVWERYVKKSSPKE